jgi:hypothetical protein
MNYSAYIFLSANVAMKARSNLNSIFFNHKNSVIMSDSQKKTNFFIPFSTILITYIIVKILYRLTGFHYDFTEGIVNIRLLIDLALWGFVYFSVDFLLKKLFSK